MTIKRPLYLQVAQSLRNEVAAGELFGELPSEASLRERFQVSRSVIRQALATLEAEGILRKSQGKPTQIIEPERIHRVAQSLNGLGMQAILQSRSVNTRVLTWEKQSDGSVRFRRLRLVDGVPFCVIDTEIPRKVASAIERDSLSETSLHDLFRSAGIIPTHSRRTITAVPASHSFADLLQIGVGTPLLVLAGDTTDQDGQTIETFKTFHASERVALDLETG